MTAPLEAPVSGPAPVSKAVADLRKDDPSTAVELWKRRVAATPESVAFRSWPECTVRVERCQVSICQSVTIWTSSAALSDSASTHKWRGVRSFRRIRPAQPLALWLHEN